MDLLLLFTKFLFPSQICRLYFPLQLFLYFLLFLWSKNFVFLQPFYLVFQFSHFFNFTLKFFDQVFVFAGDCFYNPLVAWWLILQLFYYFFQISNLFLRMRKIRLKSIVGSHELGQVSEFLFNYADLVTVLCDKKAFCQILILMNLNT